MKTLHTVLVIGMTALSFLGYMHHSNTSSAATGNNQMTALWTQWKNQYSVSYANAEEDQMRFQIFTQNYEKVQTHNAKGASWTMALNQFADLTGDEFSATYASCAGGVGIKGGLNDEYCPSAENCESLPQQEWGNLNWTTSGAVTGVKNQGQCGSCWAFSTTGALEGLNFLNTKVLVSFSEQQLVSCATNCDACGGCWPYLAMEYAAQNGIEPEKLYPYKSGSGNVPACQYKEAAAVKVNSGYQCIQQENAEQLFAALSQQPVSIAVEADQDAWQLYSSGIVNSECGDQLDHAVLLVGYSQNEEAWYVKNSWGTEWGMNGYIWIGANKEDNQENTEYGVCGILRCATIPTGSG